MTLLLSLLAATALVSLLGLRNTFRAGTDPALLGVDPTFLDHPELYAREAIEAPASSRVSPASSSGPARPAPSVQVRPA